MNTVLVRASALLLALMLCMAAFGCSNVQSVNNDKQTSPTPTEELTKRPSDTEEPTATPEPTIEPTAETTDEPTDEPTPDLCQYPC